MGLLTVLVTNGYYLEERLQDLVPYIDGVILSLDYAGEKQDQMRGCPGLYERVIAVMKTLRQNYPHIKVYFNLLLHRGNEDQIFPLAELAKELGVTFYVCPVKGESFQVSGEAVEEWKAGLESESRVAEELIDLKRCGYPVNNSHTYLREFLRDKKPYTCHLPKVSVMVYPHGDVINCVNPESPLGNVREESMEEILNKPEYGELKKKGPGL
ncbi:MAG: radical SAM protein [Bacillota bacterium]